MKYKPFTAVNPTMMTDLLANLLPRSGANADYRKGIVVGAVSTLIAHGCLFRDAIATVAIYFPDGGILNVPDSWLLDMQGALLATGKKWIVE